MASPRRKNATTRTKPNPFRGKWRIVSTDVWESVVLDEFEPAHLTFGPGGKGELGFIAQRGPRGLVSQLFIHEGDDVRFVAELSRKIRRTG